MQWFTLCKLEIIFFFIPFLRAFLNYDYAKGQAGCSQGGEGAFWGLESPPPWHPFFRLLHVGRSHRKLL